MLKDAGNQLEKKIFSTFVAVLLVYNYFSTNIFLLYTESFYVLVPFQDVAKLRKVISAGFTSKYSLTKITTKIL